MQRLCDRISALKEKSDCHAANIADMVGHKQRLNLSMCRKADKCVSAAQEAIHAMLVSVGMDKEIKVEDDSEDRLAQLRDVEETLNGLATILNQVELFVRNARGIGGRIKRMFAMKSGDEFDRWVGCLGYQFYVVLG